MLYSTAMNTVCQRLNTDGFVPFYNDLLRMYDWIYTYRVSPVSWGYTNR